jgi:acyl carrier protein
MPGDSPSLSRDELEAGVRRVVSEVLFVPEESIELDHSLFQDLGAESIDVLDLVFRLEDVIGTKVTARDFDAWVRSRFENVQQPRLTVAVIADFAAERAGG